jgi:hypothetical protein
MITIISNMPDAGLEAKDLIEPGEQEEELALKKLIDYGTDIAGASIGAVAGLFLMGPAGAASSKCSRRLFNS